MPNWEEIEVPKGQFFGWGNKPGQHITGAILSYDPTGGSTKATAEEPSKPCPQIEWELTEEAWSTNQDGDWRKFEAGENVVLTASQKNLQRGLNKANIKAGDLVRIELNDTEKTGNGTVKIFKIFVDRGAAKTNGSGPPVSGGPNFGGGGEPSFSGAPAASGPATGFAGGDSSDEPPF
jgi:hypothetical protein